MKTDKSAVAGIAMAFFLTGAAPVQERPQQNHRIYSGAELVGPAWRYTNCPDGNIKAQFYMRDKNLGIFFSIEGGDKPFAHYSGQTLGVYRDEIDFDPKEPTVKSLMEWLCDCAAALKKSKKP